MKIYGANYTDRFFFSLVCFSFFIAIHGCTYSFKGGSVPPHLKTVAIPIVEDQSGYGDPMLRDSLTVLLVNQFTSDNSLMITDRNVADCILENVVTEVKDVPDVLQGTDQVAKRRMTVSVKTTFTDLKLRKKIWEKTFSNWGEYDSGGGLSQRNAGVRDAIRKTSEDILNETVAGW